MDFPVLYGNSKNGKIKKWIIKVVQNSDSTAKIVVENGYIDGKMAKSERLIANGKNIGKSNATTALEQACNEAQRKHIDKKEKEGYSEQMDNIGTPVYPMLAQKYDINSTKKRKNDIAFPCFVQPKLDGYRCMVGIGEDGNIVFKSRVGKEFKRMEHLNKALKKYYRDLTKKGIDISGIYLDGELYSDELPFEEISGIIRVEKTKDIVKEKKIKYHMYDLYDSNNPNMDYEDRNAILNSVNGNQDISVVITEVCEKKTNIREFHNKYVEMGYEGLMLRNRTGSYLLKSRSYDLQKYKEFEDSEFKIVGFKEAQGEDRGTIIWECIYKKPNGSDGLFSVRPRGSREHRARWFDDAQKDFSQFDGKMLTVRYQELGPEGCPRFPVGIDIRIDI